MAARRSALIRGESFRARDTVATEVPNSRAISFIVNGAFSSMQDEVFSFRDAKILIYSECFTRTLLLLNVLLMQTFAFANIIF
jgi:hypothetical protein